MNQQFLIIGIIVAVVVILVVFWFKMNEDESQPEIKTVDLVKPSAKRFPKETIDNDKLVIVEDVKEAEIKNILQDFCNMYNEKNYRAIPRLMKLTGNKFAITFPFDLDFEIFCYCINYLNYPFDLDRSSKAIGWATTKSSDYWITENSANKNVMLYLKDFDDEYDNVFMTTSDNIGYKLGFAVGEYLELLARPEREYLKQPFVNSELVAKEYIEF